jgi:hypothetical protein
MAKYDFSDFDKPKESIKSSKKNIDFSDFDSKAGNTVDTGQIPTALTHLAKSTSFGLTDELGGALSVLGKLVGVENLGGALGDIKATGDVSTPFTEQGRQELADQYTKNRNKIRQIEDTQAKENPLTANVSELAGGFVAPAMGAAKGIGSAALAGAAAGGLGSLGNAEELTPEAGLEAAKAAVTGAAVGGTLGYAGSKLSDFMGHVTGSATGQVAKKAFTAGKAGEDLVGPNAANAINNAMLGESSDLTNKVIGKIKQAQQQYGKMINGVTLDNPDKTSSIIKNYITDVIDNSPNSASLNGIKYKLNHLADNSENIDLVKLKTEYLNPIENELTAVYGKNGGTSKFKEVQDLIFKNNPEAQNIQNAADAMYAPAASALRSLGIKSDNFSTSQIKNENVINNLVQKSKIAAQAEGNDATNKINTIKKFVGNNENFENLENLGQNFKLNNTMTEGGVKGTVGKVSYELGKVTSEATDNALTQALSKLPGSSALAGHIKNVMTMEPNAKNRAIFTLSQQPWFRELTKTPDDNK